MCPRCEGRGSVTDFDLTQLYDDSKSLNEGALTIPGYSVDGWYGRIFSGCGFFDPDKPIAKFTKRELNDLLYKEPTKIKVDGINLTYEGLIPKIQKSFLSKDVEAMQPHIRAFVERAVTFTVCPDCGGTRLSETARSSRIEGVNIADACAMQISDLAEWVRGLDEPSVAPLLTALRETLDSFVEIGLGYLSLDRPSGTLSGGEAQRTKMIRHLGSSLTDVTYVFDEPTIGLHPHDIQRMNELLLRLRDKGNTVLVVEHKPEAIAIADHVVDLGPGAGVAGGEVVFEGTVDGLRASGTLTGRHLDDRATLKRAVRTPSGVLSVRGADANNLQDVDVDIPLGVLVVVTGVAGSGKSSLIHGSVSGRDGVVAVDQGAIKGSRRSNPATYTGLLEPIRKAFAKANGVKPALFSANSEGACPTCNGAGVIYTDLAMMAGVATVCEECEGKRFQAAVLEYRLGGRNIAEVLAMPVTEAVEFFGAGEARTPAAHADPRPARRRRPGLPEPRPAAHDAVRRRAAAAQAGHPDGGEGRRLRPRRADHRPAPRRRRAVARPAGPAGRRRKVGHRHRAPPGGDGARRLDHRPRAGRGARRRPDRLRGHPRRSRRGPVHPDRGTPRGLRRQLRRRRPLAGRWRIAPPLCSGPRPLTGESPGNNVRSQTTVRLCPGSPDAADTRSPLTRSTSPTSTSSSATRPGGCSTPSAARRPVHWNPEHDGGSGFWSITRYDDIERIDKDPETFTSTKFTNLEEPPPEFQDLRRSILETDGPRHLSLRKLLMRDFSAAPAAPLRGLPARTRELSPSRRRCSRRRWTSSTPSPPTTRSRSWPACSTPPRT